MMHTGLRVALVNMPFSSTRYPSLQLGLLQAILARRGFEATSHYFNLGFAAPLGWESYEILCEQHYPLLGEWIFSRAAFGEAAPDGAPFLAAFEDRMSGLCSILGADPAFFLQLREEYAPGFVEECVDAVAWDDYDVVGFGSLFEQTCASLALARQIKQRYPRITTVFGGANFEDEMGLEHVRAVPWMDYVVIGEGDEAFPALLERLAAGRSGVDLPGVASRTAEGVAFSGRAPTVRDLDQLPDPVYDDYFAAMEARQVPATVRGMPLHLLYESARGCWWGAKHHCTFCGLNGLGMAFRSKSPARVLEGIEALTGRYPAPRLSAVDNILDHRYLREVFGPLAEQGRAHRFYVEVKANLTQDQLRALAAGGVDSVQPGIESLSTPVLQLMRKGTTAIQNVRLLKWAAYYGMTVYWNLLYGFPGERAEDYERQLATLRLIPHLHPPGLATRILLMRFSPNYFQAAELGIRNVRPASEYAYIYPDTVDVARVAYLFDYDAPDTLAPQEYELLTEYVAIWYQMWQEPRRPSLRYLRGADWLTIMDARQPDATRAHVFDGRTAAAYEFCGPTYHSAGQVLEHLRQDCGLEADLSSVERILETLTVEGLMMEEDGRYLSLALPGEPDEAILPHSQLGNTA
jgi:ribosomal peptide maturation radical SAM protein 1